MKKLLTLLTLLIFSATAFSQEKVETYQCTKQHTKFASIDQWISHDEDFIIKVDFENKVLTVEGRINLKYDMYELSDKKTVVDDNGNEWSSVIIKTTDDKKVDVIFNILTRLDKNYTTITRKETNIETQWECTKL
ncbi:MAG: hypothetical protein ACQERS_14390 [Bacteroidota bacterium]